VPAPGVDEGLVALHHRGPVGLHRRCRGGHVLDRVDPALMRPALGISR
jgi:hypothetical protein